MSNLDDKDVTDVDKIVSSAKINEESEETLWERIENFFTKYSFGAVMSLFLAFCFLLLAFDLLLPDLIKLNNKQPEDQISYMYLDNFWNLTTIQFSIMFICIAFILQTRKYLKNKSKK